MATINNLPDRWVRREALAGDASTRRYWRLWNREGRTAVLAHYPPDAAASIRRDLAVLRWFDRIGIRVPAVLDHGLESGWLVVEDLGPDDAEATLEITPEHLRLDLMLPTLDPLATLAGFDPTGLEPWNAPLDRHRLRWELAGFELWYVRFLRERTPPAELDRWLDELADEVAGHPRRVCHRDYHLNNLFVLPDGRVGVIDVQDVLVGPDTYDGVSLLCERSATRLLDGEQLGVLMTRWAAATGAAAGWESRWQRVRLQRALKVLGTFARLGMAGKPHYEPWMRAIARSLVDDAARLRLPDELVDLLVD
jgi:aminoglycoside/choline kinase family phosphotransferase